MLSHVVATAIKSPVSQVLVAGGDSSVKAVATDLGAEWTEDYGYDLNGTLKYTFQQTRSTASAPMYLAADLPLLGSRDIENALHLFRDGEDLILSPAGRDGGTNAIIAPASSRFLPQLGPDSFERHKMQARTQGINTQVYVSPGLSFDVDTTEDLRVLEDIDPELLCSLTSLSY